MKKVLYGKITSEKIERFSNGGSVLSNTVKMIGILLITAAASEAMYSFGLGNQNMIILYLMAVLVISSITPGYVYGILAALISTLAYDFQITAPRLGFSFTLGLPITLFIMLLFTIVTSTITARIKERAVIAFEREQRAQQMYEINQKLLAARNLGAITTLTKEFLTNHLHRPAILYTEDPLLPEQDGFEAPKESGEQIMPLYSNEQKRQVHRMFRIGESETERPFDDSSYDVFNIPVVSKGLVLGVIGIACKGNPLSQSELIFVKILVGQVALALELQYLSDKQAHIVVESEKEKMRSTLLRSFSHELRTPLTDIFKASSAILEQKDLDAEALEKLARDIKLDAQWLISMVENILIITRISGDSLHVEKKPEAAGKIVTDAVAIARKRYSGYTFHVHIPDELLLVPMDGSLISQVLINLLENAAENSPDGSLILVDLKKKDNYAEFDIMDNGSGISENLLDNLFEVHAAPRGQSPDVPRGTGLGLSICQTIVQAHGGNIEGQNRDKHGAKFSFRLPLQDDEESGR